jgi:hypothetical protein
MLNPGKARERTISKDTANAVELQQTTAQAVAAIQEPQVLRKVATFNKLYKVS